MAIQRELISIPSGAIKSGNYFTNYLQPSKHISIPSGAIKRIASSEKLDELQKISIPSGAIKRTNYYRTCFKRRNFNSFWCD